MTTSNRKGPIVDPGICRCCGAIKKCRILNVEYEFLGQKEVYSEIFVDTFGLVLSHLDGHETERLVCATCVVRLRDAREFRRQVLRCEELLLKANVYIHGDEPRHLKTEMPVKMEDDDVPPPTPDDQIFVDDGAPVVSPIDDGPLGHGSTCGGPIGDDDDRTMDDGAMNNSDHLVDEPVKVKTKQKSKKSVKHKKKLDKVVARKLASLAPVKVKKQIKEKRIQDTNNSDDLQYQPTKKKPNLDYEFNSFADTVTIVENSFVCPFYSSYSDYYCAYCRQVFTDPEKLRAHTSTHDPNTFKKNFPEKKLLLVDIIRIDCRLCLAKIDDIESLKSHLTSCHEKKFFKTSNDFLMFRLTVNNLTCTECGTAFSFFHALKKHMAEHFGPCICDICGAHYFEERMLILHQKSHQKEDLSFTCKDCGKVFKSKHSRYLHETKLHKKEPAYPCYKCDEVLFSYSLRYRHMIDVHGERRLYPCEHCDRTYDSRKSLREHNRRYHLKILKHQCDLCDKRFYLPSRLKEHMATHTGERNFRCEFCGKSYPRLRGLKVHMQSHSNEKKFRCAICNASFTQNVNLKNHMKRQHNNLDMEEGFPEECT